jgi:3-hydroxybutyryl-CoA dehydratase
VNLTPGQSLEPRTVGPVTQTDVVRFAGAGGDFNPLHHDVGFARAAGFDAPIAMGQLTAGLLAAYLTDWCGVARLRSYEVRFTAPLVIGRTVSMSATVKSVGDRLATVELSATDEGGSVLVRGRAEVRVDAQ